MNGDFEGYAGWDFGKDPVPGKYTSIPVHGGVRAVQLGITPESGYTPVYSYSSVRQAVSIPRGSTVQLRWWHYHKTELPTLGSTDNTQDRQEVILLKPNGDTLRIVQRVRRNDDSWQQDVIDLTEYAGHSFVLYFNVINYGGARTWTFIDDVELLVCAPQGGAVPYSNQGSYNNYSNYLTFTPTYTPPIPVTSTPTPTSTQIPPGSQLGNSVEQDGYVLTALSLENPSNRPSSFYQPQAGQKLVGVEILVRNISNQTFSSNPLNATLVDTSGFLYQLALGDIQGELELFDVNPGEMVQGWVGFMIPEGATPAILKYEFRGGTGATLQVGLGSLAVSSAAEIQSFSVPLADSTTATPTVTPTNTGAPSPTPSPTSTAVAFVPSATVNVLAQQQSAPQQIASAQSVALQTLPTPTSVLVANRVLVPDGCVELINNGTFEALGMGWSQEGSAILPEYSAPPPATGATLQSGLAIRLGLADDSAVAGISATQQLVQLPKESNQITLSFRYFPLYDTPPSRGDYQYVDIYHGDSGQFVGRALGVQRNDRLWIERTYDLSAFAGEAVRILFMVSNDGVGGNIAMYIDDVSVLACRGAKFEAQNRLSAREKAQQPVANASASTTAFIGAEEIAPQQGFPFGRIGGLLTVLGIAGAAFVLLPLSRRLTK